MEHERVRTLLAEIYGQETGDSLLPDLISVLNKYRGHIPNSLESGLSERGAILITYADQVQEAGRPGLASLAEFCEEYLKGLVSGVHILPFYPWSSDDGFSVIDYEIVAPQYGTWEDIRRLGKSFRLMLDAVVNHASEESAWFQGFLQDDLEYKEFFIEVNGNPDLSQVVRPRALPLLTEFSGRGGPRKLWTTFSADQIDLNYHNPKVLLKVLDILLFYASQGAQFVRLDAIAYLWKEPGTTCINLRQTHLIVQLMRAVLDEVAPYVMLVTETNVPNVENLSYFGDGSNEAQLVYNFPLPPLVLYAFQTGDASALAGWVATLKLPSERVTFLNFLASHDGIGLNPVRGLLRESEIEALAQRIEAGGGHISSKTNANGTQSPYELNANYFDALHATDGQVEPAQDVDRFVTAHAILLAFRGVPVIYFHSLFGSRGWPEGVRQTQKYRSINREKLRRDELEGELAKNDSLRARIFSRISRLLTIRREHACFAPQTPQRVLESGPGIFALVREEEGTGRAVLCIHSVSRQATTVRLDLSGSVLGGAPRLHDLISGRQLPGGNPLTMALAPYESLWLIN
jgi:sucrose phosphorylase